MKFSDLLEWRAGSLEVMPAKDIEARLSRLAHTDIIGHVVGKSGKVLNMYYDQEYFPHAIVFIFAESNKTVAGIMFAKKITDKIYQVTEMQLLPEYRNAGLAPNIYAWIVAYTDFQLINGDQLSKDAERVWSSLIKNKYAGLFDKKLDKIYQLEKIGQLGDDGELILSPAEDRRSDSQQRFYYICVRPGNRLKESIWDRHNDNVWSREHYHEWIKTGKGSSLTFEVIIPDDAL